MTKTPSTVLIIEDDPALNDAFTMTLQHAGFLTATAHNGKEALEVLAKTKVDIIILDILMPVMDGREFMQRFDNRTHIPVIALSNLDARSEIEYIKSLGITTYMLKSTASPMSLIELVTETLKNRNK